MPNATLDFATDIQIIADYDPQERIIVHTGEALDFLGSVPNDTIQLIVSSPPYNVGKVYEKKQTIESYLADQEAVLSELKRVLHPQGSICWQVGNYVESGEVFPLDMYYYPIFKKLGFQLRNRIIWHFGHGLHASKRFSGRYETLLWFTKTDDYLFNLDAVRVPSKYPGKTHFKQGPKYGTPSGNPLGKNPSDIWEIVVQDWENALWDIPNCKANHPEKTIHPCQFPVEVVERCVLAFSSEDDWVLDPYGGVGSTLIGAIKHGRKAISIDKESEYTAITTERIKALYNGILKLRPIGKPVHTPTGREKVAQVPQEWLEK